MIHIRIIYHGLGEQLWCCKCEDSTDKYNTILHSAHGDIPDFMWYVVCPNISDFRIFGCKVEAIIGNYLSQLDARTEDGYYIGTTTTKVVICYWCPSDPTTIQVWIIQKLVHFFKLHGKQYGFGIFFNPWMCYNDVLHQHLKTTKQPLPKFWMIDSHLVCSTLIFLLHGSMNSFYITVWLLSLIHLQIILLTRTPSFMVAKFSNRDICPLLDTLTILRLV